MSMTGRDYNLAWPLGGKSGRYLMCGWTLCANGNVASSEDLQKLQPIGILAVSYPDAVRAFAFAQNDFFGGVAGERQAGDELVFKVRADGGLGFVKIAAWVVFFERGGPDLDAVDLDRSAGRLAGDAELFRALRIREQKKDDRRQKSE
jgi:hypothetical protein